MPLVILKIPNQFTLMKHAEEKNRMKIRDAYLCSSLLLKGTGHMLKAFQKF